MQSGALTQPMMCFCIVDPDGMPASLTGMFWLAIGATDAATPLLQEFALVEPGVAAASGTRVIRPGMAIVHCLPACLPLSLLQEPGEERSEHTTTFPHTLRDSSSPASLCCVLFFSVLSSVHPDEEMTDSESPLTHYKDARRTNETTNERNEPQMAGMNPSV